MVKDSVKEINQWRCNSVVTTKISLGLRCQMQTYDKSDKHFFTVPKAEYREPSLDANVSFVFGTLLAFWFRLRQCQFRLWYTSRILVQCLSFNSVISVTHEQKQNCLMPARKNHSRKILERTNESFLWSDGHRFN